jgi:NHL repeat
VAGSADAGLTGDGGPASLAALQSPESLLFDSAGNLYFADPVDDRIRCIDAKTHTIRTIAGSIKGFSGDGGPANRARLNNPSSIAFDSRGNLYIADYVNQRVRSVEKRSGTIHTVAGNGLPVRHDVQAKVNLTYTADALSWNHRFSIHVMPVTRQCGFTSIAHPCPFPNAAIPETNTERDLPGSPRPLFVKP